MYNSGMHLYEINAIAESEARFDNKVSCQTMIETATDKKGLHLQGWIHNKKLSEKITMVAKVVLKYAILQNAASAKILIQEHHRERSYKDTVVKFFGNDGQEICWHQVSFFDFSLVRLGSRQSQKEVEILNNEFLRLGKYHSRPSAGNVFRTTIFIADSLGNFEVKVVGDLSNFEIKLEFTKAEPIQFVNFDEFN